MLLEEIFISSMASSILVISRCSLMHCFWCLKQGHLPRLPCWRCVLCARRSLFNEAESSSTELACSVVAQIVPDWIRNQSCAIGNIFRRYVNLRHNLVEIINHGLYCSCKYPYFILLLLELCGYIRAEVKVCNVL